MCIVDCTHYVLQESLWSSTPRQTWCAAPLCIALEYAPWWPLKLKRQKAQHGSAATIQYHNRLIHLMSACQIHAAKLRMLMTLTLQIHQTRICIILYLQIRVYISQQTNSDLYTSALHWKRVDKDLHAHWYYAVRFHRWILLHRLTCKTIVPNSDCAVDVAADLECRYHGLVQQAISAI